MLMSAAETELGAKEMDVIEYKSLFMEVLHVLPPNMYFTIGIQLITRYYRKYKSQSF